MSSDVKETKHAITRFVGNLPRRYLVVICGVIVLAVIVISYRAFHSASAATATRSRPSAQQVKVAAVADLSPNSAPLTVIGAVTSQDQATILAETSGEIVKVYKQIGDYVPAGGIIATFENSSQQAAVEQAKGSYDAAQGTYNAAQASYANASGATAENSNITSQQAAQSADNDRTAALVSLRNTYTALDDAIHAKADVLFSNPRSNSPTIAPFVEPDSQLVVTVENERLSLEQALQDARSLSNASSSADIDTTINGMMSDAQQINDFLDNLVSAVDQATSNTQVSAATLSGYQSTVAAARSEVVTAVTNLTTAKTTYDTAVDSASTAENTAQSSTPDTVAAAQAQVQVAQGADAAAQGAYDVAQAALEKTIVRSPISGTIVALPVTTGDYVNSFSQIAQVSDPGALKIVTHVTADDAQTLAVGNSATINGSINGIITRISPAIDPTTSTIEVDIGLDGTQGLVDGDSVTIDLARTALAKTPTKKGPSAAIIPIVALKIMPTGPVVFTVDQTSKKLVAHPVQIGSIMGDSIVVTQGLTPDMQIVSDARGLVSGQLVTVAK